MNHLMDQMLIAMLMDFKKELKMYDKEKEFEKAWTVMNDFGGGNTLHGMEKMEELIDGLMQEYIQLLWEAKLENMIWII